MRHKRLPFSFSFTLTLSLSFSLSLSLFYSNCLLCNRLNIKIYQETFAFISRVYGMNSPFQITLCNDFCLFIYLLCLFIFSIHRYFGAVPSRSLCRELLSHDEIVFNENGTLSTIPHHSLVWNEELSMGRREDDIFMMPNIALLVS